VRRLQTATDHFTFTIPFTFMTASHTDRTIAPATAAAAAAAVS